MSAKKSAGASSDSSTAGPRPSQNSESLRDTVEAVAIAFIMAFVFKTFEAELYVIPTGSMAPTLYGRHKEVECDACRYRYTVGASHEVDQDTGVVVARLSSSKCPNCRFPNDILNAPVFNGDRILVNKQNRSFDRFDVVVFKNPEESHVNYIKRCVGLPGETIRIHQGDIFARQGDEGDFTIQRKSDPDVQRDIQIPVYDDRFPPRELLEAGAEERWVSATEDRQPNGDRNWAATTEGWVADREARRYQLDAEAAGELRWLRYRHLRPSPENWKEQRNTGKLTSEVTPSLVADFCGFNSYDMVPAIPMRDDGEVYWVGDLTLNAVVEIESAVGGGMLRLELIEGRRRFLCDISVPSGTAEVRVIDRQVHRESDAGTLKATVPSGITGPGEYTISFANVDERLCLWINDKLIPLGPEVEFPSALVPESPTVEDLAPAGIAARNLTLTVSELVIERDIYYRNDTMRFQPADVRTKPPGTHLQAGVDMLDEVSQWQTSGLAAALRDPEAWGQQYQRLSAQQLDGNERYFAYRLADDEYMMCGDNSPASQDSRLFLYYSRPGRGIRANRYAVRRQDLIGEAVFIFWPHGVPFLNDGQGFSVLNHRERSVTEQGVRIVRGDYPAWRFPFYPNFSRMKRIR